MPKLQIFTGNSNPNLSEEICKWIDRANDFDTVGSSSVTRFPDGEINVKIHDNVRGNDVYIIQPTCRSTRINSKNVSVEMNVNESLMELLLMISTLRRASAKQITAVIPYYGYSRQDRKMDARVPISAADVAIMLESMGVDRVISVDLHCGQIQGFFGPKVPVDNLDGACVAVDYFLKKDLLGPVIVSPDAGGVPRAKKFGTKMKLESEKLKKNISPTFAMIIKQRSSPGVIAQMDLVGSVSDSEDNGYDAILIDDMIDTAGTLCAAAKKLKEQGARKVYAFASHGLFSKNANERIMNSVLDEVIVTNTIPLSQEMSENPKITVISVAPLIARSIQHIHMKKSVSALF